MYHAKVPKKSDMRAPSRLAQGSVISFLLPQHLQTPAMSAKEKGRGLVDAVSAPEWRNVVLQGSGIRSFWQGGFLSVVAPHWPQPPNLYCVSASSAIACSHAAGRLMDAVAIFKTAASRNPRNVYLSRLFSSRPMFPHAQIYRTALLELFDDAAVRTLAQGSEVQVLLCRTRPSLSQAGAFVMHAAVHAIRAFQRSDLARRRSAGVGAYKRAQGRQRSDAGAVDSQAFGGHAQVPGATFVAPSEPLICSPWDYTRPDLIARFVELGQRDGERFLSRKRVP
jgi:hypothetical protein